MRGQEEPKRAQESRGQRGLAAVRSEEHAPVAGEGVRRPVSEPPEYRMAKYHSALNISQAEQERIIMGRDESLVGEVARSPPCPGD